MLLADVLARNNDFDEAERRYRQAVELQRELLGTNHMTLSDSLSGLGEFLQWQRRLPEAEAVFREALAIRRQVIPGGLDVAYTLTTLAANLTAQNRLEEAEQLYRESMQIVERWEGGVGSNWEVLDALAKVLQSENKADELEALYREALDKQRNESGTPDVAVPAMMCLLSDLLVSRGKRAEAAELHREALEAIPKLRSMRNRSAMRSLTASLRSRGELAQAEGVFEVLIHAESQNLENPDFKLPGQITA